MNLKPATTTPQTHSKMLCRATAQETLSLSKAIATGDVSLITLEREVSLKMAINTPTIRSAFRGNDEVAYSVAHVLCKRFLGSFTFSTKLEPAQIEVFTIDTLDKFQYESLDDMVLFFKMARSGTFGTAKKGIDSNLVYGEWFPKYLELKAIEREKAVQAAQKAHSAITVSEEDLKKAYAKKIERQRWEARRAMIDKLTRNMDRQMLEDTITSWENDPTRQNLVQLLKMKRKSIK
ncbi:MAG: hypothetical protein JJE55_08120 [Flavobacteriaceae bacterium]|nr:hypothetical protein [Flavobacteriaceae bacterium]